MDSAERCMRLDGVQVLDMSQLLPGPYATQMLADAGADVIKVEDTNAGDYARGLPPYTDSGVGAIFDAVNRGKRSVALDLKSKQGREAFLNLAAEADVVFEQFRPGVVQRLGVDYESVREVNEDVIYCSLTGFGQDGPHSDRVGHDLNYVGMAGLLDMTREDEDSKPQMPGYPIGDMAGGLFAAFSIVGALLSRELGNSNGEYVDVAITDVVTSFSQAVAHEALSGDDPRPGDTALTGGFPWYDTYETKDGNYITIGAVEPKFWSTFCNEVNRPDLKDAHMSQDPADLADTREELESLFAERTREEWEDALGDVEATVAPVRTPAEAFGSENTEVRELLDYSGDVPRVAFPAKSTAEPNEATGSPPSHGEHTGEVLDAVGYEAERISALRDDGVIQ
jgi:alpha-methylacyl-CoA racemase